MKKDVLRTRIGDEDQVNNYPWILNKELKVGTGGFHINGT